MNFYQYKKAPADMQKAFDDFSGEIRASLLETWRMLLHSLPKIMLALFVLALVIFLAARISRFVALRLNRRADDQLFNSFIAQSIKYVLIVIGLMLCMQILDLTGLAGGLLAGAGVSALILGFAFKDIGENFLSGIILAFDRPFHMNDTIVIENYMGNVKSLSFRTTHIKTFDEKDVYIPNSMIVKQPLTNLTRDGRLRLDFVVGIAYEDDIQAGINLILETVRKCEDIIQEVSPFSVVEEFAASTVNLRIFFWTDTQDYRKGVLITKSAIMERVKVALTSNGFSLPAHIQELKVHDKSGALPVSIHNGQPIRRGPENISQ